MDTIRKDFDCAARFEREMSLMQRVQREWRAPLVRANRIIDDPSCVSVCAMLAKIVRMYFDNVSGVAVQLPDRVPLPVRQRAPP